MALGTIQRPQSTGNMIGIDMSSFRYCRVRDGKVHLDVMVDGKRIRRSTGRDATPQNIKYVEKNWQAEVTRLQSKDRPSAEAMDGETTVRKYGYRSLDANRAFRRENTTYEYTLTFEQHILPYFGSIPIRTILQTDLKEWIGKLTAKGLSGKRVHNIRVVFQGILKDAVADKIIDKSPFEGLKGISRKTINEIEPFTLEEVKLLIEHADGMFKNMLAVQFFTGMRSGEMLALKWSDINLVSDKIMVRHSVRRNKITDTKTGVSREIDMLPPVKEALKRQFKETGLAGGFVFPSEQTGNGYAGTASIRKYYWKPMLKRLKLPDRAFYQTRHTFATMMISRGEDITWVQQMLGHANLTITFDSYTKYIRKATVKRAIFLDQVEVFGSDDVTRDCHVSVTRDKQEQVLRLA